LLAFLSSILHSSGASMVADSPGFLPRIPAHPFGKSGILAKIRGSDFGRENRAPFLISTFEFCYKKEGDREHERNQNKRRASTKKNRDKTSE